jgi:hypothetical protein
VSIDPSFRSYVCRWAGRRVELAGAVAFAEQTANTMF